VGLSREGERCGNGEGSRLLRRVYYIESRFRTGFPILSVRVPYY
jgi:hypothetical protein